MARKMRSVVLTVAGDITSAREQEVPIPELKAGEVLVQIESSPVHPIDLNLILGLGHEGSGTVVECREGALDASLIGKRVYVCQVTGGIWAEYLVCPAITCVPLLDEVTFDQGAMFINPLTVLQLWELFTQGTHHACANTAANSSLGKMFARLCHSKNVPLINIVRSERSAEDLRNQGAEYVLNSSDPGFEANYKEMCTRLNVTVAFDAVGGEMTEKLRNGILPGGAVHVYGCLSLDVRGGHLPGPEMLMVNQWFEGKRIEERIALLMTIQTEISTTFRTEIVGHYATNEIPEAVSRYLSNTAAGKVLIHPNRK